MLRLLTPACQLGGRDTRKTASTGDLIDMEILERIWELLGVFFGAILKAFERTVTSLF